MKYWLNFIFSFITVIIKLLTPGGLKAVAAENVVLRQQLILSNRNRKRSHKLKLSNRIIFGLLTALINPKHISRIAIAVRPTTLLKFHKALVKKKYHLLYSNKKPKKPGPKGPSQEIINLIIDMKQRNPYFGYRRIAMQISDSFEIEIDKDVVRRVLAKHYKPTHGGNGPSWLTFIGHMNDSLWSVDLFRAESILLKSHWIMVVMDQFSRKIIGFAVHKGNVDGIAACRMFNTIIAKKKLPKYLSSDNDPLFTFHRWKSNLRILKVEEIKSLPCQPRSHPFVERLIGSIRRELLDKILFWTADDLQSKLDNYLAYFNDIRCHHGADHTTPSAKASESKTTSVIKLENFRWQKYCRGLFELPIAA